MSGVLILVLVAMWGLLLVPMWLRRHDEANQTRSIDRFTTAMRILSRHDRGGAGARSVVKPPQPSGDEVPQRSRAPWMRQTRAMSARPPARRAVPTGRARLLARRRRFLAVLVGLVLVSFVAALVGALSFWWQAVADLALCSYVFHLRAEAVRAARLRDRGRRPIEVPMAPAVPAVPPVVTQPVTASAAAAAVEDATAVVEESWDPTPVPLPSYVTAPVASRPAVRIIDDDMGIDLLGSDDELAEIVARGRAVNE